MTPKLHILGVRHHGPGSARSLNLALKKRQPDIILVEGPADLSNMMNWLAYEDMQPPIALVSYRIDDPKRASFYPMVVYSPEYQAIKYALANKLEVRFFDLAQKYMLATKTKVAMPDIDAMDTLAKAAGFKHYERWWNVLIEQRKDAADIFEDVQELMTALRENEKPNKNDEEASIILAKQREAFMRQEIRKSVQQGFKSIAVVCGAYHGPALVGYADAEIEKTDTELLSLLNEEVEIDTAWVPWSYSRLSSAMGYGAGLSSPGWYHHLWQQGNLGASSAEMSSMWLAKVASILRSEGFDASPAHVIEAVRLAQNLAAMRDLPFPALQELTEATQTVMTFGNSKPLELIQTKLTIGEQMGAVPANAPMVPLQRDLENLKKQLKLRASIEKSTLSLDLRKENHLLRSQLFHRLNILAIPWGKQVASRNRSGSFREIWQLQWLPEYALKIIEANIWGNTVAEASSNYASDLAKKAENLADLTNLLDLIILAELPDIMAVLLEQIQNTAALSNDISHMMKALAPLARIMRYGSVRKNDKEMIEKIVEALINRISISLPNACSAINDSVAAEIFEQISEVNRIISTLQNSQYSQDWQKALKLLTNKKTVHSLLAGRACRLLLEARAYSKQKALKQLEHNLFLTPINLKSSKEILNSAFWLEGFLKGSGMLIVHDKVLWQLLETWVNRLESENFIEILALLRRTFASFSAAIRQQIMEKVDAKTEQEITTKREFNQDQADKIKPVLAEILGAEQF